MRPGLACASFVNVIVGNDCPGKVVIAENRSQRRYPSTRRRNIRLDASIFARAAAGEIRDHIDAIAVNKEIGTIVVRGGCRDYVLGHGWAADRLRRGSGIAGRKLQNIGLVSGREAVCVADEFIKFCRADVIAALRIVAPTV